MAIITLQFRFRLFLCLTLSFILCTIIGTVSHEGGHYIIGKYLGHDAKLHYASTSYNGSEKSREYDTFIEKNKDKIQAQEKSPEKDKYLEIVERKRKEILFLILGGPVQTILTGTIGFLILWFKRKKNIPQIQSVFFKLDIHFLSFLLVQTGFKFYSFCRYVISSRKNIL